MTRFYAGYGALVLLLHAFSGYQGYSWVNFFTSSHHHRAGDNHYHK